MSQQQLYKKKKKKEARPSLKRILKKKKMQKRREPEQGKTNQTEGSQTGHPKEATRNCLKQMSPLVQQEPLQTNTLQTAEAQK